MASSSRATHIPRSYLASLPPDSEISMSTLVEEQDRLADEAREAMPYAFDECSYSKGSVRQNVWSCLDCGGKGVCYGCSISCHSDHKLVELWTRRSFRCDCPTTAMQPEPPSSNTKRRRCTLNPPQIQPAEANSDNRYNQNFKGDFCRCGRVYDPLVETEGMLCCIGCEDWFHESCLNLRPVQVSTSAAPIGPYPQPDQALSESAIPPSSQEIPPSSQEIPQSSQYGGEDDDDEAGTLILSESYDCLICAECVKGNKELFRRAGNEGWLTIVPDESDGWRVTGRSEVAVLDEKKDSASQQEMTPKEGGKEADSTIIGVKRDLEEVSGLPDAKRVKSSPELGLSTSSVPRDVFLYHGERAKLKKELDAETAASLPFPLDDEEIYEPPKDENAEETLDEVTARVVDNLPRAQAIEAVHGYQRLRDSVQSMLAGHAAAGRVVSKGDIDEMFRILRQRAN